jgi:hypothetical protein
MTEDVKKVKETKIVNKETIILKLLNGSSDEAKIKELEEKYSNKFGCKVVIIENNLSYVDTIERK